VKILLFSLGPVPHHQDSIVEGGGLRVWGLANALATNGHQVTIGIPSHYLNASIRTVNGILLIPYVNVRDLIEVLTSSQAVIYPTGAPTIANDVLTLRSQFTICIGDSYVPIHVEVSARTSEDLELEEFHFQENSPQWLRAIGQSDILLCASESQKTYLLGVLAGSGYLSPKSYKNLKIVLVPFGIEKNNLSARNILERRTKSKKFRILWYGGFYPWFDGSRFAELVKNINLANSESKIEIQITVVGALNPFVNNPAFVEHALGIIEKIKSAGNVEFIDWLPYNKRHLLLNEIDLVFCFSQPGYENLLAWRTRYLDFIKFHIPLITNNIDPLGEIIVESGAGIHIDSGDPKEMAKVVKQLINYPNKLNEMKNSYSNLEDSLNWLNIINPLITELKKPLGELIWQSSAVQASQTSILGSSQKRYFSYFFLLLSRFGLRHALKVAVKFGVKFFRRRKKDNMFSSFGNVPKYSILVHQLDFSGSPKIAIELAFDLASNDVRDVAVYSLGEMHAEVVKNLVSNGIRVEKINGFKASFHLESSLIINGLAFSHSFFDNVINNVKRFTKPPLILIHEDRPEMYLDSGRAILLGNAADLGLLRLVSPSIGTQKNIQKYFKCNSVELSSYPIQATDRIEFDYSDEIRVHLTGSTGDTRKNQLQAIDLIHQVLLIISKQPKKFRKIKLILVGVNEESLVGRQIIKNSKILGEYVEIHPVLDFESCMEIVRTCNAVMCLSDYEALPLFVSQGMGIGQIVMRNNCSGVDEQLVRGKNGISLDYFNSYSASIERIVNLLDKDLTGDSKLTSMSKKSHSLALKQMEKGYRENYGIV
jgi:glycosyltransferase involved in cell wall biosynthesis